MITDHRSIGWADRCILCGRRPEAHAGRLRRFLWRLTKRLV